MEEMLEARAQLAENQDSGDEEEDIEEFIKKKRSKWEKTKDGSTLVAIEEMRETNVERDTSVVNTTAEPVNNAGAFNLNNTYVTTNSNLSPNSHMSGYNNGKGGSFNANK